MAAMTLVGRLLLSLATEVCRYGVDRALPDGQTPDRASSVTTAWLEGVTNQPKGSVTSVSVASESSGTAGRARLDITSGPESDLPASVFLKMAPRDLSQRVLMNLTGLAEREITFYRSVAPDAPVRVPRCYGIDVDERRGRNMIVLEDLSSCATFRDVRDSLSGSEVERVVDALALLHARFWESPRLKGDLSALVSLRNSPQMSYFGGVVLKRLVGEPKFAAAELISPELKAKAAIVSHGIVDVDAFWARQPQTLTHGDPHLGNLFFEGTTPGFLDWQVAMSASGIRDVAYSVTAALEPETARKLERGLVERYVATMAEAGIAQDVGKVWMLYRAAVSEFYVAAVSTASSGERMQAADVARVGVERAVAAVEALDSFDILAELADANG